jgi:hypothetical protein
MAMPHCFDLRGKAHWMPIMLTWMSVGRRVLMILAGYLTAALAATAALTVTFALWDRGSVTTIISLGAIFGIMLVIWYSLLPAFLVIAFAEARGVRSPLFYGVTGAVAGAVLATAEFGVSLLFGAWGAIGGLFGGLAYWWMAGRNAGTWTAVGS